MLPLDSIKPAMVIRIPFEHKQAVKKELDEKYNIYCHNQRLELRNSLINSHLQNRID